MFSTLCSLSHALVNYSRFLSMRVIDVKPLDNLVFALFCLEDGVWAQSQSSSLLHVSLSSAAARPPRLVWPRNWLGACLYTWPLRTTVHSPVRCSSRQQTKSSGDWEFRREGHPGFQAEEAGWGGSVEEREEKWSSLCPGTQVDTGKWKHDDDLSDPEYEYTHTTVIMTEGILKYSRFCDKNILMIHFLLLSQNYPQPDNEIHQKNLCSRSSKI